MSVVEADVDSYGPAVNYQQVYELRNAFSKLMDLKNTCIQVDGPLMYFTFLSSHGGLKDLMA
jgi:hypothetical protein